MLLSFSPAPAKIQARQDLPAQCAPESGLDSGPLKSIDRAVSLLIPPGFWPLTTSMTIKR